MCNEILRELRAITPIDTGNLKYNAIKIEFSSDMSECRIYVDEAIAPYMPYTNEPWISPKWNGKKNPNEGWWTNFSDKIAEVISRYTGVKGVIND